MTRRRRPTTTGAPASGDRYIDDDPDGERARTKLSKKLDRYLRLDPDRIGLELDAEGWADVEVLAASLSSTGPLVTSVAIRDLVRSSDEPRFELTEDGARIRTVLHP